MSDPSPPPFHDGTQLTVCPSPGFAAIVHSEPYASGVFDGSSHDKVTEVTPVLRSAPAEPESPVRTVGATPFTDSAAFGQVNITDTFAVRPVWLTMRTSKYTSGSEVRRS